MSIERTLSLIKPHAVESNITGLIISRFEKEGLKIIAQKRVKLTLEQAKKFYEVHKGKPFYEEIAKKLSSGPIIAQVLKGENAIARNREIMGATNPADAASGTLRKEFGVSIDQNVVHGSDACETAAIEIGLLFSELEITD